MANKKTVGQKLDWYLLITIILMYSFGVVTLYSVAHNSETTTLFDFSQVYGKQLMWISFSAFLGILIFLMDTNVYKVLAIPIYLATLVLLVIVLFMPPVNGARAWLGIGSLGIQPAEFAKIGTALLIAKYISKININQQSLKTVFISWFILLIPMGLILMQPDAGTFVVFTSFLFVYYREGISFDPLILKFTNAIPGVNFKQTWIGTHFIPIMFAVLFLCIITLLMSNNIITLGTNGTIILPGFLAIIIAIILLAIASYLVLRWVTPNRDKKRVTTIVMIGLVISMTIVFSVNTAFTKLASHQKERIELFLGLREDANGSDYNRNRAMAAVGSGGLKGKGYFEASLSSIEANHVPESETDFIFCPLSEEWGFFGSITICILFTFMLMRIIIIAERQRSTFVRVYAYCVAMIIFYHFAINIGMNIGLAPVIGIPLPLFSYGGSSIMSFSIMFFLLLKFDSERQEMLS